MAKSKKSVKSPADVVLAAMDTDPIIGRGFVSGPNGIDARDCEIDQILEVPTAEVPMVPAIPAPVDTVSEILGVSGEVPTPEKFIDNAKGKFNLSAAVKSALGENVNMTRDDVLTHIEDTYGKTLTVDFPDGTFTNTLSVMRKKLKTVDNAIAKEESGIDPVTALKLCQKLNVSPMTLRRMIEEIQDVGTPDAVLKGLAKLQELQELMNASSKTAQ